jgi:hypothetical protein
LALAEDLVAKLTDGERRTFTQRPITLPPRARRKAVEVVPSRLVPECGVKDVRVEMGVHCTACGLKSFAHGNAIDWMKVVCRSDLWASPRTVGAAKDSVTAVRWSAHGTTTEVHA